MKLGPHVASAMRWLGLRLDARGLVPLAEARKRVRAAKTFERGKYHVVPGQTAQPTDADYLWAALLSLDNAAEFVREASRLAWKFSPRGDDNVGPHERFGDAILPWLATFVDDRGRLALAPSCVLAGLAVVGDPGALDVIQRIRTPARIDVPALARAWIAAHGPPGSGAAPGPSGSTARAAPRRPRSAAPAALTAAAILEVLDAAASSTGDDPMPWPARGASVGHFEPHAMRVIAARARKGDDWGLLFEVVQGDVLAGPRDELRWPMTIQHYRYGSRVPAGGRYLTDARPIGMHRVLPRGFAGPAFAVPARFDGVKVVGPRGTTTFVLTGALVKQWKLRPGRACSDRIEDWPSVIAVRARLARDPDALWRDPRALAKQVLALADPLVVVATDAFAHVSGPASGARGPDRRLPSASRTFQSIAAAIVARDATRFVPGKPNVSWRDR